jgi:hypothetical protein
MTRVFSSTRATSSAGTKLAGGCVMLFGLPFLAAGIAVLVIGLRGWFLYSSSASWETVPATVEAVRLETHHGSESTTYSVEASYRYDYNGRTYTGERVGISDGGSSEYKLHKRRYDELEQARAVGETVPALVHPGDPQQSLLYRELDLGVLIMPIFGLVFATVGGALVGGGILGLIRRTAETRRREADPDRPWNWPKEFRGFTLQAKSGLGAFGYWGIGGFLAAFLSIFHIAIARDENVPFFAYAIVWGFTLAPLALLGMAVYRTLQWIKFGSPELHLMQKPLVLGGSFDALLAVRRHIQAEDGVKVTFLCEKATTSGHGKHRSTHKEELHSESVILTEDMAGGEGRGSGLPIHFDIPAGLPTRDTASNPSYTWKLKAEASTPGVDFSAEFDDLPVYELDDPALLEVRTV